jgi:hypothetical protein
MKQLMKAILIEAIEKLNADADVDGILVQLPLPKQISEEKIINLIHPDKDVDGFHPMSIGKMVQGFPLLYRQPLWNNHDAGTLQDRNKRKACSGYRTKQYRREANQYFIKQERIPR